MNTAAEDSIAMQFAIELVSFKGHDSIVRLLLIDPRVTVTKGALLKTDSNGHELIIDLLLRAQHQVIKELCRGCVECKPNGSLRIVFERGRSVQR